MDAHGGNFRRDLQFYYLFSQQAYRPSGSAIGCWRARKGSQASVKGTVEAKPAGLAQGLRCNAASNPSLTNRSLRCSTVRSGIAQQQCAGMSKSVSCCLAAARQFFQSAALILAECNAITGCHTLSFTQKTPGVNIRNIIRYVVLA